MIVVDQPVILWMIFCFGIFTNFSKYRWCHLRCTTRLLHGKVDLKSAYRSVNISKDSQRFTGLQFSIGGRTIYMRDTKLPFGSRLAPGIFHRLTQAVKRMMARRGFTATVALFRWFLYLCTNSKWMRYCTKHSNPITETVRIQDQLEQGGWPSTMYYVLGNWNWL